jgi:hypothetical protein
MRQQFGGHHELPAGAALEAGTAKAERGSAASDPDAEEESSPAP